MDNDEFRRKIIAAYCRARKEGHEKTAEGLLDILTFNLRDCEKRSLPMQDATIPPFAISRQALH